MAEAFSGRDRFLGIDIGTSGVKAVLFDRNGTMAGMGHADVMLMADTDGRAELDPDAVVTAVAEATASCMAHADSLATGGPHASGNAFRTGGAAMAVVAVGLSCIHHSLMAVAADGTPLTRATTWADNRAVVEAEQIADRPEATAWYHRTGCRVQHPIYPLSKLLWLRRHEPDIFERASRFVTIKEYLLFRLFGEWVVDDTLASAQGFFDIHQLRWDSELLSEVGISPARLSQTVPCTHVLRGMHPEWARRLGLKAETPVVVGSGDGIMANLGSGVFDKTVFSSTIGTSGAIRTTVDAPLTADDGSTWCYAFLKDSWVAGGAINSGAVVLSWLRREFGGQFREDAHDGERLPAAMDRLAAAAPAGSEGLLFLPYLLGERAPDWNANARGMLAGLDFSHTRGHLIRAAMEGVMYRMFTVDRALSDLCGGEGVLRASGGYTHSDLWLQIQADMFNREVQISEVVEAGALGAAFLAMYAVGAVPDLSAGLPAMRPARFVRPNPSVVPVYGEWRRRAAQFYASHLSREGTK